MKQIGLDELKRLQIEVLNSVSNFCQSHNIKYSLACGTMLGSARHGGYIPWDDDIDIYMLRDDYEHFIKDFPAIYDGKYKIVCLERDLDWDRPYAKAFDVRTSFWEPGTTFPLGVNIDIFPVDDVPEDESKWLSYNKKRLFLILVFSLRFVALSKNRSLGKNLIIIANRLFTGLLSKRTLAQFVDRYAKKHNGKGYNRCFETVKGVLQKKPFKKSLFDSITKMPFEDRLFNAFLDYDEYLTTGFGNWRELPPVEKRVTHHLFKAYWK